jgi:hypothetical protein
MHSRRCGGESGNHYHRNGDAVSNVGKGQGMSRPLLNSAGRALPVDDAMRLSGRPQVSV